MLAAALALALVGPLAGLPPSARAQVELTEVDPPDGAQLASPPKQVHLCFSEPVHAEDVPRQFSFDYLQPDGVGLGIRIVFQPGGECVDVEPGLPDNPQEGEYTLEWKVTARETAETGSGTLHYLVGDVTPTATGSPAAGGGDSNGDGAPDILLIALLAIGIAGGAVVLGALLFFFRRAVGREPSGPPEDGEGSGH